jgi:hypothetical protein
MSGFRWTFILDAVIPAVTVPNTWGESGAGNLGLKGIVQRGRTTASWLWPSPEAQTRPACRPNGAFPSVKKGGGSAHSDPEDRPRQGLPKVTGNGASERRCSHHGLHVLSLRLRSPYRDSHD